MEGHLSIVCALVLVLGAVAHSHLHEVRHHGSFGLGPHSVKYGVCPKFDWFKFEKHCENHCSHDKDCADHLKCCRTGCGLACVPPHEKHGSCPPLEWFDFKLRLEKQDYCLHDWHCYGDHKCCDSGRGRVCAPPYKAKKGSCPPRDRFAVFKDCKVQCTHDYDCGGVDKCCHQGCGRVCVRPHGVKPGKCPSSGWASSWKPCLHAVKRCSDDYDCKGKKKKCCKTRCGYTCVSPIREPKVKCPHVNWNVKAVFPCVHKCSHDWHCERHHKCCSNGCGRVCVRIPGRKG